MKLLRDLLRDLKIQATCGPMHAAVAGLTDNSKNVGKDFLFVAVRGTVVDGHTYLDKALEGGACAVVCEVLPENPRADVAWIQVANSAEALGRLASNCTPAPRRSCTSWELPGPTEKPPRPPCSIAYLRPWTGKAG